MFRLLYCVALLTVVVAPAEVCAATPAPPSAAEEAATYKHCLDLASKHPQAARFFARAWERAGGAHPAEHCAAAAYFGLGKYKKAALLFDRLAAEIGKTKAPRSLRAHLLDQGGEAWLMAADTVRATADLGAALTLLPNDPGILVDRAQVEAMSGNFGGAVGDLDRVLEKHPKRLDALIYRASAYRALGRLGPALADADKALALSPRSLPALLERGNIRRLEGDIAGARADWRRILKFAPKSAAAEAAAANLARLGKEKPAAAGKAAKRP